MHSVAPLWRRSRSRHIYNGDATRWCAQVSKHSLKIVGRCLREWLTKNIANASQKPKSSTGIIWGRQNRKKGKSNGKAGKRQWRNAMKTQRIKLQFSTRRVWNSWQLAILKKSRNIKKKLKIWAMNKIGKDGKLLSRVYFYKRQVKADLLA